LADQEIPYCYGTQRFISMFTKTRWVLFTPWHPVFQRQRNK